MIAPLRLDARLFDPVGDLRAWTGRPRVVGKRQPNLNERLTDATTSWQFNLAN
ncbi:MAG: hypothetical protein HXX08_17190 [Chloroflexi bacterium]|uniref:Uncharacterized protein n=1 Tax=Candidatus Chlorohelix allophototropha TaxID=3003348 RepID=A0A8T7M6A6_9CHLR|nr:hypothetical protein [Chloroflexota bacterium]WJW69505.1 hypothetical protein OZ401_003122 [Chloroflexota bacterium L227-S17]